MRQKSSRGNRCGVAAGGDWVGARPGRGKRVKRQVQQIERAKFVAVAESCRQVQEQDRGAQAYCSSPT